MAFKVFSVCLVIALSGMCLCQSEVPPYPAISPSQASVQPRSATVPQIKLEDIERDSLVAAAAYGQKTQQQSGKPVAAAPAAAIGQPQPQQQSYQAVAPQQQYYVQSYQAQPQQQQQQQQQFYVQPYNAQPQQYLAQPYQSAFDYPGVQYMFINPSAYNPANPIYQQYYVPAAQPSTVPQYVTKQSTPVQAQQEYKQQQQAAATPVQVQQQYKQQFAAVPVQAQQQYKQQFAAAPSGQAQQEYRTQFAVQAQPEYKQQLPAQQQYVVPSSPAYQYVQQPAAAAAASPVDFSYITSHPTATGVQFKPQPQQVQYNTVPQQFQQQQYYYTVPAAAAAAVEQPRAVQQSAKSQYSSGVKSTTPTPYKESFAYKFESSPPTPQQQPAAAAYSTLRYSA